MSLKTLLQILCATTIAIFLIAGSLLYFFAAAQSEHMSRSSLNNLSQGIATTINGYVTDMTKTVDRIAIDSDYTDVTGIGDPSSVQTLLDERTRFLPGLLRMRILPPDIEEPDTSHQPPMGFADLVLVRNTLESETLPAIHGSGGPHVHLAIARKIVVNDQILGIVLASYSIDKLRKIISRIELEQGAIELKQGQFRIAASGENILIDTDPTGTINIGKIGWKLNYWIAPNRGPGLILFFSVFLTALTLLMLLYIFGYRWLTKSLKSDQTSIVKIAHNLILGKIQSSYPMIIKELQDTAPMLARLKRLSLKDSKAGKDEQPTPVDELSDSDDPERPPPSLLYAKDNIQVDTVTDALVSKGSLSKDIFRAYDIRGVVGKSLTEDVVKAIGQAFGSEADNCGEQTVVIAHDGRLSSPKLSSALAEGLQLTGCNVIDIGMVPTPVLYFATHFLESNSGIMITGSHNPPDYNGLKLVLNGETLSGEKIQSLRKRIESNDFVSGSGTLETQDLGPEYVGTISEDIQIGQPVKVAVDCGNGVAGEILPVLLRSIGCEVIELFCDIDGNFPNHHPDPSKPENLTTLIESIQKEGADLGLAFDGDGDRLGVVDSAGKIIWPDRQMMLFSADVLSRQPGADIIFDVKCSKHLASEIVKHGGRPIMWKTGHSLIKAKIKETGAQLAGEMSGHIFFTERWFGFDDALYSAARLLEILSADPRSSSEIFAELPDSVNTPEINVTLAEGENFRFIDNLLSKANFADAKLTTIDGLRVDFSNGWGLVRASNTTPSLVLRFEADNQQALEKIQAQFKKLILSVKPELSLPF